MGGKTDQIEIICLKYLSKRKIQKFKNENEFEQKMDLEKSQTPKWILIQSFKFPIKIKYCRKVIFSSNVCEKN